VPSITGVTPDSAVKKPTETGQFTLFIDGNGFMSTANGNPTNSTVDWFDRNTGIHTNLSLSSITAAQIQAVVPYPLIRDGKTVEVTVSNPGPGGGPSNVQPFFVTDTTATVTSSETAITNPATGTASTTSVGTAGALLSLNTAPIRLALTHHQTRPPSAPRKAAVTSTCTSRRGAASPV
jgi:hypothetical protein